MATKEKVKENSKQKDLKITLVRGIAKADKRQQKVLTALGLRRSKDVVFHDESPVIKGMIVKVNHLVSVENNK
jgi:large subunit ribosomal protein L30